MSQKSGWSNDNQLQVSYQKLYHRGIAWQVMYDWQKNLRDGGNWSRDNQVDPYENYLTTAAANTTFGYPICTTGVVCTKGAPDTFAGTPISMALPPKPPTGTPSWAFYHALDKFENYGTVDTATPKFAEVAPDVTVTEKAGNGQRRGIARKCHRDSTGTCRLRQRYRA